MIEQETSPPGQLVRLINGQASPNTARVKQWHSAGQSVVLDAPLDGYLTWNQHDLEVVPFNTGVGSNNPPIMVEFTPELATFLIANCDKNVEYVLGVMMKAHGGSNGTGEDLLERDTMAKLIELSQKFREIKKLVVDAGGSPPVEE